MLHRVGQGRVPRRVRNLARAERFPFNRVGEILGCRQALRLAWALDLPEQGDGTVKAAGLEVMKVRTVRRKAPSGV
jgi:hypothetical protein